MTRWLGWLLVAFSLVVSCGVQALTLESVSKLDPPGKIWCSAWDYTNGGPSPMYCFYPTELAAAQAFIVLWNAGRELVPGCKGGQCAYTLTGCNGNGHCTVTGPADPMGNSFYVGTVPVYCPVPTVDPTNLYVLGGIDYGFMCVRYVSDQCQAPNAIDPSTGKCEPPKTYTITLSGATTTEPSSALPFTATVKDQNGFVQSGKQVTITLTVKDGSGGHIHTDSRPKGFLLCSTSSAAPTESCNLTTGYNGEASFIFLPLPISGTHTITGTCGGCDNTETKSVDVMVKDLIPIPASPALYALTDSAGVIGAVPNKHTANHYLTAAAILQLKKLATLHTTKVKSKAILYLNDASLEWGGLFDVGSTPWSAPHNAHDRGVAIDIRAANSGSNNEGAVLASSFREFITQAAKNDFNAALHCTDSKGTSHIGSPCYGIPNNRHIHVNF